MTEQEIFDEFQRFDPNLQKAILVALISQSAEWSIVTLPERRETTFDDYCLQILRYLEKTWKGKEAICTPTGLERTMRRLPDWEPTTEQLAIHAKRSGLSPEELLNATRKKIEIKNGVEIERQRLILEHQIKRSGEV